MVESLECRIQKCAPIFISELNDDITITDNHSNVNIFLMHAYSNMHYMHYMHLPLCLVGRTRGQWPNIPASTRAMRNRHVVLYDLNYPSKYITPNDLGGHLTSDFKSATLITLVSMCILPLTASEAMAASKRPQRSYDLRFDISNHDYPGIHEHIASNGLRGHDGPPRP